MQSSPKPTAFSTSKRPTFLLLAVALALGALGVSLLIKALFFPTEPQGQGREPASAPQSRSQH
jgi:hypothetical protein